MGEGDENSMAWQTDPSFHTKGNVLDPDECACGMSWPCPLGDALARIATLDAEVERLRTGIGAAASLVWSINPEYKIRPKAMMDTVLGGRLMLLNHFAELLGRDEPWLTDADAAATQPAAEAGVTTE